MNQWPRRRAILKIVPASLLAQASGLALAQDSPPYSLAKILVGYTPGASSDTTARRLAEGMAGRYANNVIVENKSGAAGRIAVDALRMSRADGTVLLLAPASTLTLLPHTTQVDYDPFVDLVPVSLACTYSLGMAVGTNVPSSVKSVADWLDYVKSHPAQANYASPAAGTTPHFIGMQLAKLSGTDLRHIGYRGIQPAMMALLSGEVSSYLTPVGDFLPYVREGKLRLIATSGAERSRFAPDVPTFKEQGFQELVFTEWYGVLLPKATPQTIVTRAHGEVASVVDSKTFSEALAPLGLEARSSSPADMKAMVAAGYMRWKDAIRKTGFSVDS